MKVLVSVSESRIHDFLLLKTPDEDRKMSLSNQLNLEILCLDSVIMLLWVDFSKKSYLFIFSQPWTLTYSSGFSRVSTKTPKMLWLKMFVLDMTLWNCACQESDWRKCIMFLRTGYFYMNRCQSLLIYMIFWTGWDWRQANDTSEELGKMLDLCLIECCANAFY